jgi:hypothetical protein
VNRANAQTGEEIFAAWQVEPRLGRWQDTLNFQYLPLFGATGEDVEFGFIYPAPRNREQDNLELTSKANAALALVTAGYEQRAVLRAVGLPDMDVALEMTKVPALPPRWTVPLGPGAPGGALPGGQAEGAQDPESVQNAMRALRASGGWDSKAWDALEDAQQKQQAVWNSLAGAR